uniref:DUF5050 domain-containing protein n=1 Tax=Heterorhabditis bacteriophora TaxID=37862 RepID=A0A1I7WUD1_HETBA
MSFDESNRMFTLPTSFSGDSREYIYFGYFSEPISYHDQIIRNRLEGPYITEEGLYIYRLILL